MSDSHIKILLIDDDKNFRKILSIRLKSRYKNCELLEAPNLHMGQQYISENPDLDLIILDQHLPDGTGSEFLASQDIGFIPVLSMSSDDAPEIPAATLMKGARFFLAKKNVSEPFFLPLTASLIERSHIEKKIQDAERSAHILSSVKTLLRTLQHEINNPLGALLGGVYVLQSSKNLNEDEIKAIALMNESTMRIKKVLDKLAETTELELVNKATETLYQIPGDPDWTKEK